MPDEPIALNVDEMIDFVLRRLELENVHVTRDVVARIFDLELDFMFLKGTQNVTRLIPAQGLRRRISSESTWFARRCALEEVFQTALGERQESRREFRFQNPLLAPQPRILEPGWSQNTSVACFSGDVRSRTRRDP